MKHLAIISTMEGLPWGGSEYLWSQTAAKLAGMGVRISINFSGKFAASKTLESLSEQGASITHRSTGLASKIDQKILRKVAPSMNEIHRWLNRKNPDLVLISSGFQHDYPSCFFSRVCRECGVAYSILLHAASKHLWFNGSEITRYRDMYKGAKHCFFVSQENRQIIENSLGIELAKKSTIVNNPISKALRRQIDFPSTDETVALACVGRLQFAAKGQDLVLQTLGLEKWTERDLKVFFYGEDHGNLTQLKELIKKWDLEKKAIYKGFLDSRDRIWSRCHGLILPSRHEGVPMVTVEAMLAGRIPIVTDCGRNAELISEGETGFLIESPSVQAVDRALDSFWKRRDDWPTIGANASHHMQNEYPDDPISDFSGQLINQL